MIENANQSSGTSRSYWVAASRSSEFESLSRDIRVDVAIVGAGIAGLSCAFTLSKLGLSVAVLEDGLIGSGETSRTTGHLSTYVDGRFARLLKLFGIDALRLLVKSHEQAINHIEKTANEEHILCDFKRVDGYLFSDNEQSDELKDEMKVLKKAHGVGCDWVEKAPFKSFDSGRCIKFQNQAQFHSMKYLRGLASAIIKQGGQIFEATHVKEIQDGSPCIVRTSNGSTIIAKDVIVATNSPINNRLILQTKLSQYRTYVIGVSVPRGELEEALYWDMADPYHYIRMVHSPKDDRDYVLIGGGDHKTGEEVSPQKVFSRLREWATARFLQHEIIYEWSGQVVEPVDGIAFTGRNPGDKHIYVHTGSSGSGLTYGAVASTILSDLISGKKSNLEDIYAPSRKTLGALGDFLKDTCCMASQYADWAKPHLGNSDTLSPQEGAVLRHGLRHVAIYKDVDGNIHKMSAVCPHLGGVVRWNALEKTWDCPCHGSRFTCHGEVINGPANCGLTKMSD